MVWPLTGRFGRSGAVLAAAGGPGPACPRLRISAAAYAVREGAADAGVRDLLVQLANQLVQLARVLAARFGAVAAGLGLSSHGEPENSSPRARPPDYDDSSARRDHQASAAVIALSASWMPSPVSPAVAAQCKGIRAKAPGSQRCSSGVSGSGAVPS